MTPDEQQEPETIDTAETNNAEPVSSPVVTSPAVFDNEEDHIHPQLRWWGWLLSLVMVVGVIACIAFPVKTSYQHASIPFTTTTTFRPEWDPAISEVAVDALINAFNNSIEKTKIMYHGQTLRTVGVLVAKGEDSRGPYVDVKSSSGFFLSNDSMRCYFEDAAVYEQTTAVPIGSELYLVGECRVTEEEILFEKCAQMYVSSQTQPSIRTDYAR